MSATIVDLFVNLIGNDASLIASTKRSGAALEGLAKKNTSVKDAFMKLGQASALALSAIVGYSLKAAADFQADMELINTQAGVAQNQIKGLSNQVLALAPTVGIGPDKLAEGLYHIESAGFRGNEAMEILKASAMNAAMGMSNLEDSSQAVIGVLAEGLPDIKNAADAAAILNTTVGIGDMRMQQLSSAISTGVLGVFKVAGLGMRDFSAGLATMTDNVTPANVAATRLRMAIALLSGPSGVSVKALESVGLTAKSSMAAFKDEKYLSNFGINMTQLSADLRKPDGLIVALQDLQTHLRKSGLTATEQTAVITRAFGGARTAAGIEQLLSELPRLQSKYKDLGDSTSRLKQQQEAWANQQKTFKQQTHELGASLQVMAIQLGTALLPTFTKFVNFLTSHQALMKAAFATIVIGLGLITVAWIVLSITMMSTPVGWIIMAIIVAIAALALGIYELVKHWSTVWGFIKRIAMDVWHWLVSAWNATWGFIKRIALNVWNWLVSAWKALWNTIKSQVNWIHTNIITPIVNFFMKYLVAPIRFYMNILMTIWKAAWNLIRAIVVFVWNVLAQIFKNIWNTVKGPLTAVMSSFASFWKQVWNDIVVAAKWAWNNVIHPIVNALVTAFKWAWAQIVSQFNSFKQAWTTIWDAIKKAADIAWSGLKVIWGYIQRDGIDPLKTAINTLKSVWSTVWDGIKSAVSGAWNFIKPILDKIGAAIGSVKNAISGFENNAGGLGKTVGNFLTGHFADGGRVPGAPGQPMLAVVHGGEYVLSQAMQNGTQPMTGLGTVFSGSPSSASFGGSNSGTGTDHFTIVADGKALFDFIVTRAQRNKRRNTSTFLT